jgi:UDP-N-acetylmuramoyl-tripeptide--D-alanyl-D-alanine ligase
VSAWREAAVTAALGLPARASDAVFNGVATDTRKLGGGELFVALRGENHDAHAYLAQAKAAGATGAVVEHVPADAPQDMNYFVVPNTLHALGSLARLWRRQIGARVCAVAGSNGKTTTKDLLKAALGARYRVHATQGNFNNLIGAPLTLLAAPTDTEVIVAEIGTNAPGEIAQLAALVEPDAVVITGISAEHLEGLGDLQGVLREETSVIPWIPLDGTIVVADDPPMLGERARTMHPAVQVAGFTAQADAAVRGSHSSVDDEGRARFRWAGRDVALELRGSHNARNALLALGVAQAWDVPADDAIAALAAVTAPKMRSELRRIGDMTLIVDCYNANPASMLAAADLLASMKGRGARIAILGTMREMGPGSADIHTEVANAVVERNLDLIVATGDFAEAFGPHREILGSRLITVADPIHAFEPLSAHLQGNEVVLLKGSRGVALERLLPRFEEWGSSHPHGEALGSRAIDSITGSRDGALPAGHPQASPSGTKNGGG